MRHRNLHDFIGVLESNGELIRIEAPVDPYLEITEITDRVSKSKEGGKALLFENVIGSAFPVLTNAFGSAGRIRLALGGQSPDQVGERLRQFLTPDIPKTLGDKLRLLKQAFQISRCLPRAVKISHPPCQEIVYRGDDVDLSRLPVLHCWPGDAGPFITLPVIFTKDLQSGKRNVGMYRLQVLDKNTTGMHWHIHKDGAHIFRKYENHGKKMEVAVAIGSDPSVTYAATAPMPPGMDEMLLAGFIRQKAVTLVPAVTVDLEVPAEAEIILEGYINPKERRQEGPFGDHTGYYSLPDPYPVFHVTAITHRRNAVYSTTVVGRPPMEDCYLAMATERIFLPLLQSIMPEITDCWLPWEGCFHNAAIVAIDKEYPGHARKVMNGLWGMGQMSFCKAITVVDGTLPLGDRKTLLAGILSIIDLKRDIFVTEGVLDVLDHSAPFPLFGGKIGIDATEWVQGESPREQLSDKNSPINNKDMLAMLKAMDDGFSDCRVLFPDIARPVMLLKIKNQPDKQGNYFLRLLFSEKTVGPGIFVLLEDALDICDDPLILWKVLSNVDPCRDIMISSETLIMDATGKKTSESLFRPWPDELINSEEVKSRVTERLQELGLADLLTNQS